MPHVFRFHEGNASLNGWDLSQQYDEKSIAAISDPAGGAASLPITSIPSPFANFELVRSAFDAVTRNAEVGLTGVTIYHKLVSYALDVLEIFYNYRRFQDHYEIIEWSRNDLKHLKNNPLFHQLGRTLELYMEQDAEGFNFGEVDTIYLLNCLDGPEPLNIVGATSPTSLCVASANRLDYVTTYLTNHRAFDESPGSFKALHERSDDFIYYVWLLSRQPRFNVVFREVYDYIQACFAQIGDSGLKQRLVSSRPEDYQSQFEQLALAADNRVSVLRNLPLHVKGDAAEHIAAHSDFRIRASKSVNGRLPLVLPTDTYTESDTFYTFGPWLKGNVAPLFVATQDIDKRELPFDGTHYPFLTPADVFQPYLVRLPYPVSADNFFSGWTDSKDYAFMLPLKRTVLDYLSLSDLQGMTTEVHPHPVFHIETLAGGSARATFRIPIQRGKYITFERIYYNSPEMLPDDSRNVGVIRECACDLYLYPFFRFRGSKAAQRVALIDAEMSASVNSYELAFYDEQTTVPKAFACSTRANKDNGDPLTTKYYSGEEDYDYILFSAVGSPVEALIVPLRRELAQGNKQVDVAVDFGTTNTHVEYKVDGQIYPFEITGSDVQSMPLHDYLYPGIETIIGEHDLDYFFDIPNQEFVPLHIGGERNVHFPTRTAMCRPRTASGITGKLTSLADVAIGFHYERYVESNHNETVTNLKWTGAEHANLMEAFFEELLLLIRNKVLSLGGALERTGITWFYPVSMLPYQRSQLTSIWNTRAAAIISPQCRMQCITESLAPYYYYKNTCGVTSAVRPVVSMDIGGETTDFVVYNENRPLALSSVRFAGNSLFGDFYGTDISRNGFVQRYEERVLQAISAYPGVRSSYEKIRRTGQSADVISFMFSLQNHPQMAGQDASLSQWLSRDYDMKFVLLLFYIAQLYYAAQLLKARGIGSPAYLTVSGTASKLLSAIGEDDNLQRLTQIVFNRILSDDGRVELRRVDNPKVITCKGGLDLRPEDMNVDADSLKTVFSGSPSFDAGEKTFSSVTREVQGEVLESYKAFVDFFLGLDAVISFQNYFGVPSNRFPRYREILLAKADEYLATMLDERGHEASRQEQNPRVGDALFFYPVCGAINALGYAIAVERV